MRRPEAPDPSEEAARQSAIARRLIRHGRIVMMINVSALVVAFGLVVLVAQDIDGGFWILICVIPFVVMTGMITASSYEIDTEFPARTHLSDAGDVFGVLAYLVAIPTATLFTYNAIRVATLERQPALPVTVKVIHCHLTKTGRCLGQWSAHGNNYTGKIPFTFEEPGTTLHMIVADNRPDLIVTVKHPWLDHYTVWVGLAAVVCLGCLWLVKSRTRARQLRALAEAKAQP